MLLLGGVVALKLLALPRMAEPAPAPADTLLPLPVQGPAERASEAAPAPAPAPRITPRRVAAVAAPAANPRAEAKAPDRIRVSEPRKIAARAERPKAVKARPRGGQRAARAIVVAATAPVISCILPSGEELALSYASCRSRSGVIYR
jgi:hypothetical protein